ncbi:MAG TPA: PDZ domain-containing protein [Bacteroidetes bacterium]|nr:PDZ domain-containing protein [Bacteroidota bacterium]
MKKLLTFLLASVFASSFTAAQIGEKWDNWSERFAENMERIADKVGQDAEKNAEKFADFAEKVADDVERKYERGAFGVHFGDGPNWNVNNTSYLGIHSDHLSKRKAEKLGFDNAYGSYVSKVIKHSAADKAGIQPFDYIYGVNDQRTSNNQDISDILDDYEPGEEVTVLYIRNGEKRTVRLTLGAYNDFDWQSGEEEAFLGVRPADGEYDQDLDGVSVEIVNNSSAEEMGLEDGDIIKSINGHQILDWNDLGIALNTVTPGDDVPIVVERDGREITKNGPVRARATSHAYTKNKSNWNWDWDSADGEKWSFGGGAFLGVFVEKISERKARKLGFDNPYGSYITSVIKNTGADKAGLKPFDYIYGIDEYRVGEEQSLGGILRRYETGDEAVVHIYRKGKKMKKEIVFLAREEYKKTHKNKCEDPFFGIIQINKGYTDEGVRIKPVRNSTAADIGLEEGDIITHINGYPMIDWTDIGAAIDMNSPGDIIIVDYLRDNEKRSASGKIASYAETKNCADCDCDDHKGFAFDFDPGDIKISGGNTWIHIGDNNNSDDDEREDVSDIEVGLHRISDDDARSLGSKGIDMPISNDLEVERLKLSPNPNMGMFELEFDLATEGNTMVKVFNQSGRAIYEYDLGRFSGDFSDYIDIAQNGAGTYFLQISQNGKTFVRKIVLAKN